MNEKTERNIAIFILIPLELLFCVIAYMTKSWVLILMAVILLVLTIRIIIIADKPKEA